MSREIKFRAYDHVLEKMLDMRALEKSGMNLFALCEGVDIVKVMQYTGLKDKNGTEIYEGDIVESTHIDKPVRGWIVYSEIHASFNVKYQEYMSHYKLHPHLDAPVPWQIIGNIYENPELIGGGKQ